MGDPHEQLEATVLSDVGRRLGTRGWMAESQVVGLKMKNELHIRKQDEIQENCEEVFWRKLWTEQSNDDVAVVLKENAVQFPTR